MVYNRSGFHEDQLKIGIIQIPSLLDPLLEETLTEFPEVLGHNTLGVLSECEMDSFAKDLGRGTPFLDNAVDERLLNNKGIVPRQLASPRAKARCKPRKRINHEVNPTDALDQGHHQYR